MPRIKENSLEDEPACTVEIRWLSQKRLRFTFSAIFLLPVKGLLWTYMIMRIAAVSFLMPSYAAALMLLSLELLFLLVVLLFNLIFLFSESKSQSLHQPVLQSIGERLINLNPPLYPSPPLSLTCLLTDKQRKTNIKMSRN